MRVVQGAIIECDGCGKAFARLAPPHTPHTKRTERRVMGNAVKAATARRWRVEGPSLMAGDACPRCVAMDVL